MKELLDKKRERKSCNNKYCLILKDCYRECFSWFILWPSSDKIFILCRVLLHLFCISFGQLLGMICKGNFELKGK